MKDVKDWSLSTKVFQMIVRAYGTPDVDLMASTLSRKSPFFYSWNRRDLEVLALDSLSRDIMWNAWTGPYLFPIILSISKVQNCGLEMSWHDVRKSPAESSGSKVSRCSTYWQGYGMGNILSEQTKRLVESSWRGSTESQYSSSWNAWLEWTAEQGISSTSPTLSQIMEYFSYLYYELKREYRTINTYRSALSSTLAPIDGFPIGQHPLITRQRSCRVCDSFLLG